MLISKPVAEGIRDGRVTVAFRRWDVPRVKVGGTQLTPAGVVRFDAVSLVRDPARLTARDARAAGMADVVALQRMLAPNRTRSARGGGGGEHVYRVRLSWAGEDPRLTLRAQLPTADDLDVIGTKLDRLDAAKATGPWTTFVLEWIAANPHVVSKELAALMDRELAPLKIDIRKLKALGLTISHDVGYELSPRGRAYLQWRQERSR